MKFASLVEFELTTVSNDSTLILWGMNVSGGKAEFPSAESGRNLCREEMPDKVPTVEKFNWLICVADESSNTWPT